MKRIKYILLTLGIIAGFGLTVMPSTVGAINVSPVCDSGAAKDNPICNKADSLSTFIKIIVDTLLFVLGAVSVVTIIIAGIRYTTSHGDPKAVQIAKDTLLYAVVGLVVAMLSYALVNFVIDRFFPAPKTTDKAAVVMMVQSRS